MLLHVEALASLDISQHIYERNRNMCGIVGYTGTKPASAVLLDGLAKLEYRGYDSAGIAVLQDGELQVVRRRGKVADLAHTAGHFGPAASGTRAGPPTASPPRTMPTPI